jgi:Flp pilus assembly protein TadG
LKGPENEGGIMKKTFRHQDGQSAVLIALLMIGMIAMVGLIFDGGNAYIQRRRMQNAADAAALAGGRALALARSAGDTSPTAEYNVQVAINNYIQYNGGGISAGDLQAHFVNAQGTSTGIVGTYGGIPPNTTGVSVTASTSFPTFFLGVVDVSTGTAGARALVQTGGPEGVANLFPVAVPTGTLTLPVSQGFLGARGKLRLIEEPTSTLLPSDPPPPPPVYCQYGVANPPPCQIWGENTGPGSSGWTNFKVCGAGGSNYLAEVLTGVRSSGTIEIGDSICTETGTIAQLGDELLPWVGKNVVIPVYDCTNAETSCPNYEKQHSGSNLKYHVAAFAVFKFTGFYVSASGGGSGGDLNCDPTTSKFLCGQFQRWATQADIDPTQSCPYGLCGFQMWQ